VSTFFEKKNEKNLLCACFFVIGLLYEKVEPSEHGPGAAHRGRPCPVEAGEGTGRFLATAAVFLSILGKWT
jgi:hypothetical protein